MRRWSSPTGSRSSRMAAMEQVGTPERGPRGSGDAVRHGVHRRHHAIARLIPRRRTVARSNPPLVPQVGADDGGGRALCPALGPCSLAQPRTGCPGGDRFDDPPVGRRQAGRHQTRVVRRVDRGRDSVPNSASPPTTRCFCASCVARHSPLLEITRSLGRSPSVARAILAPATRAPSGTPG